jgi:hypothetical protein
VIPFVSGVLIWQGMLNLETGWVNQFLQFLGIQHPPNWLNDSAVIYPALVMIGIWGIGAGIIVNLAGLRGIPTELYDAARIDGAGWWASLRHVTLPLMTPIIFYTLILAVVDVLQYFLVPLVLKNGTGEPGVRRSSTTSATRLLHVPGHVVRATLRGFSSRSRWWSRSFSSVAPAAGSITPGRPAEGGDPGGQRRRTRHPGRPTPVKGPRKC